MSKLIVDTVTNMPEELRVELEDMVERHVCDLPSIDDGKYR